MIGCGHLHMYNTDSITCLALCVFDKSCAEEVISVLPHVWDDVW